MEGFKMLETCLNNELEQVAMLQARRSRLQTKPITMINALFLPVRFLRIVLLNWRIMRAIKRAKLIDSMISPY